MPRILALVCLLVVACTSPSSLPTSSDAPVLGGTSSLVKLFTAAERVHGVPAEILATVSFVETRLRFVQTAVDHDSESANGHGLAVVGLMALQAEPGARSLERAASLAGFSSGQVVLEPAANVMAAAALLAATGGGDALDSWREALVAYGGDGEAGRAFAEEVYAHLQRGWRGLDAEGAAVTVTGRPLRVDDAAIYAQRSLALGYPSARWMPAHSSNYTNANRGADDLRYIVIHTTQGAYNGAISWFRDPSSNVSAHYVVRSSDGEITQMLDDRDIGWHDACFNSKSIGIEHEGWVEDPDAWYTDGMYMASARLTAWLADQYGIPKDRAHIMGHGETPDCSDHGDPGSGWDWDKYMALVRSGGEAHFDAAFMTQDTPARMYSGEERVVWFELENRSSVTWGVNETRLATAAPLDRASPFFVSGNWLSESHPSGADHSTYAPGTVGRFSFVIRAPNVEAATNFSESFQLVHEGQAFGPVMSMEVTVAPRGPGDPPSPTLPDVESDDRADATLTGGCAVGGAGTASWAYAILLASALVFSSRRRRR